MEHQVTIYYRPEIVLLSIGIAFIASYVSITLYDQYRLCSKENKPKLFSPNVLLFLMACSLGGIAIWCMHFIGMAAVTLKNQKSEIIEIDYRIDLTVTSLCVSIVSCLIGLWICARDKSFTKDKKEKIKDYINLLKQKTIGEIRNIKDKNVFILENLFIDVHILALGGTCAAIGVCVMHYIGMEAMIFKGHIVWSPGIITASVIIALIAATAAFWIMFRLLALYPNYESLRVGSAVIMSLAVNGMHYTGMGAAKFQYYEDKVNKIPNSNLISQSVALEVSILVGVIIVFLMLIVAIADIRSWYYNLQSVVQIADAQAKIYYKAVKTGELREQAFVNDWLELRFNEDSKYSSFSSQNMLDSKVNVSRGSRLCTRHNSIQVAPSLHDFHLQNNSNNGFQIETFPNTVNTASNSEKPAFGVQNI